MLIPLNDTVIVIRDEAKDQSDGGILLPENNKRQERTAKIVAVGPGRFLKSGKRSDMPFNVGDRVMIAPIGAEVFHDGINYVIVKEKHILAII